MLKKLISLPNLTLLTALSLSSVAAYYSIIGLTAIFAGAVIPIIVMGSILEVGKITTTVWLRKYWKRCGLVLKLYLVPAVVMLAFLTSMGIFGFLSKAHSEHSLVSGDVQAKLEIIDEKIKTAKDNIETDRKQLKQMDDAVDQIMGRSSDEKGADKANSVRKSQQRDRIALAKDIETNQTVVSQLNEEAAPIRAEVRKVEAEVGPIKYIAAFIYGDNPDNNLLERAVRWVIILLVVVFDPLAIALVLAANASKEWDVDEEEFSIRDLDTFVGEKPTVEELVEDDEVDIAPPFDIDNAPFTQEEIDQLNSEQVEPEKEEIKFDDPGEHPKDDLEYIEPEPEPVVEKSILEEHPYLLKGDFWKKPEGWESVGPLVYNPEKIIEEIIDEPIEEVVEEPISEPTVSDELTVDDMTPISQLEDEIVTEGVTVEIKSDLRQLDHTDHYVIIDGRHMSRDAAKSLRPDLFKIQPDNKAPVSSFGTKFPVEAYKGDTFVRVDTLPNRVYKFDGERWITLDKTTSDSYLHNLEYIKYLVSMIESGQYDVELLSENEKQEIEEYLRNQNV